jgi:GNAT superfamily N-acetyltransferase
MRDTLAAVEEHARALAARGGDRVEVGPFDALFDRAPDGPAYASPARPTGAPEALRAGLDALAALFAARDRPLRVEFSLLAWPELPPALAAAGFVPEEESPLLVCTPAGFAPRPAGDLALRWADGDAFLAQVMRQGFELRGAATDLELPGAPVRYAYAERDGRPAGSGCSTPVGATTEISAVSTLPAQRRRGVAQRLVSFMADAHFAAGGRVAWACAPDPRAAALLQSVGFDDAGVRVAWRAP